MTGRADGEAMRSARVEAARAALATHDALRAANAKGDSFELGYDDLPLDASGWLQWHEHEYKPAYAAWMAAMDRLAEVLGADFPGRHPFRFRPVCQRIVAEVNDPDGGDQDAGRTSREGER